MNKNYIDQIKDILSVTGWSQVKLAEELGITFASLNRWLNLHAVPHPSTQKTIRLLYKEKVGILPLAKGEIKKLVKSIAQQKEKHKNIKQLLKDSRKLREDFLLELTYNSNAIEGSTLTKKETEAIIFDHAQIKDKSYIEHLEATNHAAALEEIFDGEFNGPINEKTIKGLHKIILQGISPDAGRYSKHHRAIRGVNLVLPAPEDVPEEMRLLLKRINHPKENLIEHIAKMHASFEAIHPFGDGNGRTGRLIMIIQLLNAGFAPAVIENRRKAEYYEVLEFAQKKSETHLVRFLIESIQKGYQIIKKHKK
jgi:Fic family protein